MKKCMVGMAVLFVLSTAGNALSDTHGDCWDRPDQCVYQTHNPADVLINSSNPSYSFSFDIAPPYEPGIDTLVSGSLEVFLRDDSNSNRDGNESVSFYFDDSLYSEWHWFFVWYEVDEFNARYDKEFNVFADLQDDGLLNVTLYRTEGDFYFEKADLAACWDNGQTPVPEPATMLLFGSGLAGLAGAVRRKRK